MKFFSGFSLKGELEIFNSLLHLTQNNLTKREYTLIGFSYGAILALQYAKIALEQNKRIQEIIFLSPAFFEDKQDSFKRLQILSFKKDYKSYLKTFYYNATDNKIDLWDYFSAKDTSLLERDLKELLYFSWENSYLSFLVSQGVKLWCFLGENDKIISSQKAIHFFKNFGEVWLLKNKNHCLL